MNEIDTRKELTVYEVLTICSYKGEAGAASNLFLDQVRAEEAFEDEVEMAKREIGEGIHIDEESPAYFSAYGHRWEYYISINEKKVR